MNSRLTRLAAKALQFAEEEATALGQKTASAHILLGILRVGQGLAWTVLSAHDVTLDGLRQTIADGAPGGSMEDAMSRASKCAELTGYSRSGLEHLFVALMEDEDDTVQAVFAKSDIPLQKTTRTVLGAMNSKFSE